MPDISLSRLRQDPLAVLAGLEQGSDGAAIFHLGRQRVIYLADAELAASLFSAQSANLDKYGSTLKWWLRRPDYSFRGRGLNTHDKNEHLRTRRALQPYFNLKQAEGQAEAGARAAQRLLEQAADRAESIDLYRYADALAMGMTLEMIADLSLSLDEAERLTESFHRAQSFGSDRFSSRPRYYLQVLRHPRLRLQRLLGLLETTMMKRQLAEGLSRRRPDLVPRLDGYTAEEQEESLVFTALAGLGPVAAPMTLVLAQATQEPLASELREEAASGALAGPGLLERFPLAQAVALEALRLGSGWQVSRTCKQGFSYRHLEVRPGDWLLVCPYWLHRNPAYYPDPEVFRPERWDQSPPRAAFTPFGYGARKCLGANVVDVALTLAATTIAQGWQLELPAAISWMGNHEGEIEPRTPLLVRFRAR